MLGLFRLLADRLKAMFVADVASDFEAQLIAREAERRADLLRQAENYRKEGLDDVADRLRRQAEELTFHSPLASALPALAHLQTATPEAAATPTQSPARRRIASASTRKQGKE